MLKMIRQFTFHHPKQIIAPTLWLFLSQAFSILPAILAYMAIYLLGQAFYPPYTLDIALLIKIAIIGITYVLLQYAVELISYYNTYGRAYLPCERAYRFSACILTGNAAPEGGGHRACRAAAVFPDDWRRVPCDPCFAAVSRDRGRRGSHAYPSPLNGGIHTDPTDPAHDKSRRRTLCLHDGAWSALFGGNNFLPSCALYGKGCCALRDGSFDSRGCVSAGKEGRLLIELKNLSFSYENSSEAKGQLRGRRYR